MEAVVLRLRERETGTKIWFQTSGEGSISHREEITKLQFRALPFRQFVVSLFDTNIHRGILTLISESYNT